MISASIACWVWTSGHRISFEVALIWATVEGYIFSSKFSNSVGKAIGWSLLITYESSSSKLITTFSILSGIFDGDPKCYGGDNLECTELPINVGVGTFELPYC